MPCYYPRAGVRSVSVNPKTGKHPIIFPKAYQEAIDFGYNLLPDTILVSCGQCIGCRLAKSREWAIRCMHEASFYDDNVFLTLTYDNDHLPEHGTLVKRHMQLFMKRLRKKLSDRVIRCFYVGEYGGKTERPHYHAILFNCDFPDKEFFKMSEGNRLYKSEILSSLWPYGFANFGSVTFDSCAYVARYALKKVTGKKASEHYGKRIPEFAEASRRGGIGKGWFEMYHQDVFPNDCVVVRSRDGKCYEIKPPRYYDKLYSENFPDTYEVVKDKRLKKTEKSIKKFSVARLKAKEYIKIQHIKKLFRPLENGDVENEVFCDL